MSALAALTGRGGAPTPDREMEFAFSAADHRAIADLIYAESGILLPESKAKLIYGRLARRLRACGLNDFPTYLALVESDAEERARAVDALTTNHTSFFRENHHFEHFRDSLWPEFRQRLAGGGRVRIWSAACSSGEEPYSLMMTIAGQDPRAAEKLASQDFRLLATDLSPSVIATARAGRYALDTTRAMPAAMRSAWCRRVGEQEELHPALRAPIAFRELNLLRGWPMKRPFDVIFCRNVMIYFDDATKARLMGRFADQMVAGGIIYIGHAERIPTEVADRFRCIGRTAFQKVS
ncbi:MULTISPECIES: CheR family methyltransferase [unclassified Sphingomonas]|uniref:CheR family methyltransferase n=1 Tax=Sphingomonas TaxID=13687 RepID=UPI002A69C40D|nr:CheR family methyltransferase [Sphingomonas sp. CFBP8993]MDY0959587.1 CheR family methyltransferase [Sphingomonas sp. CFBP8993]